MLKKKLITSLENYFLKNYTSQKYKCIKGINFESDLDFFWDLKIKIKR